MGYGWSIDPDEARAASEATSMLKKQIGSPDFLVVLTESSYQNNDIIARELSRIFRGVKVFGLEGS